MSTETLASHVDCDEVARLVAAEEMHLLCLERTAVAPELTEDERRRVRVRIARSQARLDQLGADLPRNDTERNGTHHG